MQTQAGVPPELINVVQALIVLFVAAPALVRGLARLERRKKKADKAKAARTGQEVAA